MCNNHAELSIETLRHDEQFRDKLEVLGYGLCDRLGEILPIGRGDNFQYHESGQWLCNECYNDITNSN